MGLKIVVLDDHATFLHGIVNLLKQEYAGATILTFQTADSAMDAVKNTQPDLIIVDLCIPQKEKERAEIKIGIRLLESLLQDYPSLNIAVQSTFARALIRLRFEINNHEGGFVVLDKSLSTKAVIEKVGWSLQGVIYIPREFRSGIEVKPEWMYVLSLAFQDGLQDAAIARHMNLSTRTVRTYWNKIQNALEIYPEPNKNMRIQTEIKAREEGLID